MHCTALSCDSSVASFVVAGTLLIGIGSLAAYEDFSTERCVYHAMGTADAVEPLTRFLLEYV